MMEFAVFQPRRMIVATFSTFPLACDHTMKAWASYRVTRW